MNTPCFRLLLPALAALFLAGCGHMDLTPQGAGNPARTISGTVNYRDDFVLPPDTVVIVRVLDPGGASAPATPMNAMGEPVAAPAGMPPEELGEAKISNPGGWPVSFRIEFQASDDQLRRGLLLEARISYGGGVRLRNVNSYAVTAENIDGAHDIWVNPISP